MSASLSSTLSNRVYNTPSSSGRVFRSPVSKRVQTHPQRSQSARVPGLKVYSILADTAAAVPEPLEDETVFVDLRTPKDIRPHPKQDGNPARAPDGYSNDPWTDPKWVDTKWTVFRGKAYDLTSFLEKHPGGNWLINLSLKRDCTGLFESYHMRPEIAGGPFKRLPMIEDFPVDMVPRAPYPNDSALYNNIRNRVRSELFDGAKNGEHRQGSEWAAACVLGWAALTYSMYVAAPSVITGALLGTAGAWIGLTIQHCGNHGAMSTKPWFNNMMGMCNDLIGGSSLMWRYHHQVSHHIHCNDTDMDEDVYSTFPMLRFDARMPKRWWHKFQHIYMWMIFPLMQAAFELGDMKGLITRRTSGASIYGADAKELATVPLGKVVHYLGLSVPLMMGVPLATVACSVLAYAFAQGFCLAPLFAVSHNVDEAKNTEWLESDRLRGDWAVQQILTSANWGNKIGCFFTGGLNLQIEHHLFPAVSFMHYPAISNIVREEATKLGVPYNEYKWLPQIIVKFQNFMKKAGNAPAPPGNKMPERGGIGSTTVLPVVSSS
eukprot:CAMPEP_0196579002 /NCGR_PEP_ID=MMETSP1081-20130531/15626_1 /TAXON_ID=36882 /ORGANISM="Pyramimonas amylifera, Strain CCMP720" /LENGTH=546 /DNA_ID=CAMNT_0041898427 /DNA_START=112 /DNA_END=1752 /DNA_ORIENTATION=+